MPELGYRELLERLWGWRRRAAVGAVTFGVVLAGIEAALLLAGGYLAVVLGKSGEPSDILIGVAVGAAFSVAFGALHQRRLARRLLDARVAHYSARRGDVTVHFEVRSEHFESALDALKGAGYLIDRRSWPSLMSRPEFMELEARRSSAFEPSPSKRQREIIAAAHAALEERGIPFTPRGTGVFIEDSVSVTSRSPVRGRVTDL